MVSLNTRSSSALRSSTTEVFRQLCVLRGSLRTAPPVTILSTMSLDSSENIEDSFEDREQPSKDDGPVLSSANRELIEEYSEDRMRNILMRWFNCDFKFRFNFPETFNAVPAHQSANRIWRLPMSYEEVSYRLLGQRDNVEPNVLPAAIIRWYSEIVESASKKFADLQQQLDDNEHHIKVLDKARENDKPPKFLLMKTPEVRLFPDESAKALQQSFRKILDGAAREMLECTLKERHLLRAKLCREAEQLIEDVEKEAMTKWMEAQGDEWNGWDHLYPQTRRRVHSSQSSAVLKRFPNCIEAMQIQS